MKMRLYAGDMHLNKKDGKKYVEIKKFDFLGNKTVKTFFLVQMFHTHMGYLAIKMF